MINMTIVSGYFSEICHVVICCKLMYIVEISGTFPELSARKNPQNEKLCSDNLSKYEVLTLSERGKPSIWSELDFELRSSQIPNMLAENRELLFLQRDSPEISPLNRFHLVGC